MHDAGGVGRDNGGVADHDRHAHPLPGLSSLPLPSPHTMPEPSRSGKRQGAPPLPARARRSLIEPEPGNGLAIGITEKGVAKI